MLERYSGCHLVGRSGGLLREGHDSRTRDITRLLVVLVVTMELLLKVQLMLLLRLLVHASKHDSLSSSLATTLWSASRLGCRVSTGQSFGWVLETILARSATITFDMRPLTTGACRDGRKHNRGLIKVSRDG